MDDIPNEQESYPVEKKVEKPKEPKKESADISAMKPVMKTAFMGMI